MGYGVCAPTRRLPDKRYREAALAHLAAAQSAGEGVGLLTQRDAREHVGDGLVALLPGNVLDFGVQLTRESGSTGSVRRGGQFSDEVQRRVSAMR